MESTKHIDNYNSAKTVEKVIWTYELNNHLHSLVKENPDNTYQEIAILMYRATGVKLTGNTIRMRVRYLTLNGWDFSL